MPRVNVGGVGIDPLGQEELQQAIVEAVCQQHRAVFAYANIHAVNLARHIRSFRDFLEKAAFVYCDGEGVRLGARILGSKLPPRVALTYWIYELCALSLQKGFTLYFLGSTEAGVQEAVNRIRHRYEGVKIAGYHHGYFRKDGPDNDAVLESIRTAHPDILFVGFGMPLQEEWIARNLDGISAGAILPCGSMIDYVAGLKRLAPAWMSSHGLEWMFRLLQEPRRLWRRYLLGIPLFFSHVLMQSLRSEDGK